MAANMPRTSHRTRIGESWAPSAADIAFAERHGIDPDQIADAFRDYHLMHGSLMASWAAAWRTWCRNQTKWERKAKQRLLPLLAVTAAPDPSDPYGAKKWAASLPDVTPGTMADGSVAMCINGYDVAGTAVDVCRSAGLAPEWRGELTHIAEWLRDGVEPERILAVIRGSARPRKAGSWWHYDARVRGQRAAS